jgi:hypothetical protein
MIEAILMKPKLLLCLALVLNGVSAFSLAFSLQIKPGNPHSDFRIQSSSGNYQVVLLPSTNMLPEIHEGLLDVRDGDKPLASCSVAGVMVTKDLLESAKGEAYLKFPIGAKVFKFQVATNLLVSSKFSIYSWDTGSSDEEWFYLKDFNNEK